MKTKSKTNLILVCAMLAAFSNSRVYGQSNYMATNTIVFPRLIGGGNIIPAGGGVTNFYPNSFPFNRIVGDEAEKEFMNYAFEAVGRRQPIPEIMPTEQDTDGNWGMPFDGMQVSLRFRQYQFIRGEMVPAYMILRNLGTTTNMWWRNGPPDYGYQFTLQDGTNAVTWMRAQQKHLTREDYDKVGPLDFLNHISDSRSLYPEGDDPYWYIAEPHTEGLTIVYLNRFFDLSQPGKYTLQVQATVPTLDGKGTTNIVSGTATFEIVEKLSPVNK